MERNELHLEKWGRGERERKMEERQEEVRFQRWEGLPRRGGLRWCSSKGNQQARSYQFTWLLVVYCIIRRLRVEWSTVTGSFSLLSLFVPGQAEQEKKTCQGCRTNENVFLDEVELMFQIGRKTPLRNSMPVGNPWPSYSLSWVLDTWGWWWRGTFSTRSHQSLLPDTTHGKAMASSGQRPLYAQLF